AHPDSFPCGPASYGGSLAAESQTPVPLPMAAGVEDGFDDEPGVLAGIARAFLSVAIVFVMTMGLWTASRSPVPRRGSNVPAVAEGGAFSGLTAPSSTSPSGRYRTKPIGEIRTGERVLAANPQVDHAVVTASEIDPATWRNIRLRMQKPHGGTLDIVLLRPLAWLAEQVDEFEQLTRADSNASALGHAVGRRQNHAGVQLDSDVGQDSCWIHLALPELGAVGPAEVLAIEPCPPLASGPGRTVTGTFAHAAADVLDLEIEGLDTPLGCTANHPFWSADRHDFVPAGALTIGEHLRTESGTLRQVTRITPRRGPPVAVFNLEVDAEHVYYVSTAGVLVHNAYPGGGSKPVSHPLKDGVECEAEQLTKLGLSKNSISWRPTIEQTHTAAFKVIVGKAKYTKGGLLKGSILDSKGMGLLEIKGGTSVLNSTYQLRLQTYMSLMEGHTYTIRTSRPINPSFNEWLQRWSVTVQGVE
ncbi:MAG: polymorphic toxin-type HINT domain-containing protein, partial [Planctomycetaceae bacterium]